MPHGQPFGAGDVYVQSDLARSMEAISRDGIDAFYRGDLARRIGSVYERQGGLLRYADLAAYSAEETPPISTTYAGLDVYQSAPNSQGIVMLIARHVETKVADVPTDELLSKGYAAKRRELIRMDHAMTVAPAGDPRRRRALADGAAAECQAEAQPVQRPEAAHKESGETSSFSIADAFGNLVSVTHSVNGTFGSGMFVDGTGIVLNNRMPYYSLDEGDVNEFVPGKRTRHTVNPALALKEGKPYLAWNMPSGDNQPQAMLQAFLALVHFGMNVQQAVEAATVTSSAFAASMCPGEVRGMLTMPSVLG